MRKESIFFLNFDTHLLWLLREFRHAIPQLVIDIVDSSALERSKDPASGGDYTDYIRWLHCRWMFFLYPSTHLQVIPSRISLKERAV